MHNYPAILKRILSDYALPLDGYHGIIHWARVHENGMKVAEVSGADIEVVKLFPSSMTAAVSTNRGMKVTDTEAASWPSLCGVS